MRGRDRFYNLSYSQSQFWQQETNMKKNTRMSPDAQLLSFIACFPNWIFRLSEGWAKLVHPHMDAFMLHELL